MNPAFCVVICTRNRAEMLGLCLESLRFSIQKSEKNGRPSVRVIVVDNASTDGTGAVCAAFAAKMSLSYIIESNIGLSHARNAGYKICDTEYVVYLDDDAKPRPSWVEAIHAGISRYDPDIFGGPYSPFYIEQPPDWILDEFGSAHLELTEGYLSNGTCLSGGNLGWRVSVLTEVGGFPTDLGMVGDRLRLGEETSLLLKLYASGNTKVVFLPEMHMDHYFPAAKMRVKYMASRSWRYGWQLKDISPLDPILRMSVSEMLVEAKFGLPPIFRLLRRHPSSGKYRTYLARYVSLHGVRAGVACRRAVNFFGSGF